MSAPPQAIAPNPHTNLLNVYIQIANKMGFQQNKKRLPSFNALKTNKSNGKFKYWYNNMSCWSRILSTETENNSYKKMPITMAALTVVARSNTGVVGSNHSRGMDASVRLFCVCR
jgi:hypothetical protein